MLIVGIVFSACVVALLAGRLIRPLVHIESPYFPMLMTGFEAGMMGYAIFERKYQEQALKRLKRQAAKLGMQLVPAPA